MQLQEVFSLIFDRSLGSSISFKNPEPGVMSLKDQYKISSVCLHYSGPDGILVYGAFTDFDTCTTKAIIAEDYDLFKGHDTSDFIQTEEEFLELLGKLYDKVSLIRANRLGTFYSNWSTYPYNLTC